MRPVLFVFVALYAVLSVRADCVTSSAVSTKEASVELYDDLGTLPADERKDLCGFLWLFGCDGLCK